MTHAEDFAQRRLEAEGLIRQHASVRLQEQLISLLRPAIALNTTRVDDTQIPVGASKFVGAPDVPEGFEWPMWNEEPLPFLVQINLEEVVPYDEQGLLPQRGLLSFFFAWEDWSGTAENDCRIFWFDSPLARATHTSKPEAPPSFAIAMEGYWEIEVPFAPVLGWTQTDVSEMQVLTQLPHGPLAHYGELYRPKCWNKILGYGDGMYGAPISSLYYGHGHSPWHSLLQLYLPQFPGGEPNFGDAMILYFSIHPDDLKERRFHKAQFEVGAA